MTNPFRGMDYTVVWFHLRYFLKYCSVRICKGYIYFILLVPFGFYWTYLGHMCKLLIIKREIPFIKFDDVNLPVVKGFIHLP